MLIAPSVLCLLGEAAEFVIVVFRHLAGVVADDAFGFAESRCEAPLHSAEVVAVVALGRALYKKVPPHLQTAFDEGNLLFISFRDYTRHSWNSALQRNWGAAGLAEEIYFTQFDNTSSLSTLHFTLDRYSDKAVYVLK